jgi:type IV pilus assembly protein PilW
VIKRAQGQDLESTRAASGDNGKVYLRATGASGMLLDYDSTDTTTTGADIFDWTYVAHIYYVQDHFSQAGDGIPSLFRKTLGGPAGNAAMQTEDGGVAPGIEYFHVLFGIDDDGDGAANVYTSSPTAAEIETAVTARIYILARSMNPDPAYTNDKVYQLGDVTKDYSDSPDNFYRRVFTTSVRLRNQANRILLDP